MKSFLETVRERVVIYDGAMGTDIQERNPSMDDFWGKENCSEVLVLSRPDIIKDIHAAYFKAGCDVVETNTFGGTRIVLGEFDLEDKVHEINMRAAKLAREVAQRFFHQRQAALRGGIDRADDQAAFAGTHQLRRHGQRLS